MERLVILPSLAIFVWHILSLEVLKEREPSSVEAGGFVVDPEGPKKGHPVFCCK